MTETELNNRIARKESFLVASDGEFIGILSLNRYKPESISNPYGPYGSRYSVYSIWNPYSNYGSQYSLYSPNNRYSAYPPSVYLRGRKVGVLSCNQYIYNRIDPNNLSSWMKENMLF